MDLVSAFSFSFGVGFVSWPVGHRSGVVGGLGALLVAATAALATPALRGAVLWVQSWPDSAPRVGSALRLVLRQLLGCRGNGGNVQSMEAAA